MSNESLSQTSNSNESFWCSKNANDELSQDFESLVEKELIRPHRLFAGDTVGIVSPSSGALGDAHTKHELALGRQRLNKTFGLSVLCGKNTLMGSEFIKNHPESRAEDIKEMFADGNVKAIFTAIGGDDTYRTVPHLMGDPEFINNVKNNPKIFVGYSDTTVNHLMFRKLGLQTYYGPSFLTDLAELGHDMLPYTKQWIDYFFEPRPDQPIYSSPVWYEERKKFDSGEIGINRIVHEETHGYEVLFGAGKISGALLGGCIESLYELIAGDRYPDQKIINNDYCIMPSIEEWQNKIFFFETSEEKPSPQKLQFMLRAIEEYGVFDVVSGMIIGKPQDEVYYNEYKSIYAKYAAKYNIPTMYNFNFGHAYPKCILPYGATIELDFDSKTATLKEEIVK